MARYDLRGPALGRDLKPGHDSPENPAHSPMTRPIREEYLIVAGGKLVDAVRTPTRLATLPAARRNPQGSRNRRALRATSTRW